MNEDAKGNKPAGDSGIQYPLSNDIVFGLVMQDVDICRELIERILPGQKIRQLRLCNGSNIEIQKTIITGVFEKGVRLDVLFEGDHIWYDIDMQRGMDTALPKRGRYYASAMDIDEMAKGAPYEKLRASYVIFICTFDYYGQEKAVYRFENYDVRNNLPYGDESYKIIVNTVCPLEKVPDELRTFFAYVNKSEVAKDDEFIKKVDKQVRKYNTEEWRRQIMTLEEKIKDEARKAREDGLAEGLKKGQAKGLIETCQELGLNQEETMIRVEKKFSILRAEAEEYMSEYWK